MKTFTMQQRARRFYNYLCDEYDQYEARTSPKYFDTYNGNIKRTLTTLEGMGLARVWCDNEDSRRVWASPIIIKENA